MSEVLMQVDHLRKEFQVRTGGPFSAVKAFTAVNDISFEVPRGQTLGLVGESGSGKSTVARLLLRLIEPTAGEIRFNGDDVVTLLRKEPVGYCRAVQMIFQDSGSSFNPRRTVGEQIVRPMRRLGVVDTRAEAIEVVAAMFDKVGLNAEYMSRYPHEFSGGQRQRLGIARALTLRPEFLILDEPTSALDVSIQAQILNLLLDLQAEFGFTYLFIGHDLGIVEFFCDRIAVMYQGRIVEQGETGAVFRNAEHAVTRQLLASMLSLEQQGRLST